MADHQTAQLSLDLGLAQDELATPVADTSGRPIVKTMLFPRHVRLPHFGQIQRQLKQAFSHLALISNSDLPARTG